MIGVWGGEGGLRLGPCDWGFRFGVSGSGFRD